MRCLLYKMRSTALTCIYILVTARFSSATSVEMAVKSVVLLGVVLASLLFGFRDAVYARELTDAKGLLKSISSLAFYPNVSCVVSACIYYVEPFLKVRMQKLHR